MTTLTLKIENDHDLAFILELAKRLHLEVLDNNLEEDADFRRLTHLSLNRAYGENEPEYTDADIKEFNPNFKPTL
jgi:hypothetical protein